MCAISSPQRRTHNIKYDRCRATQTRGEVKVTRVLHFTRSSHCAALKSPPPYDNAIKGVSGCVRAGAVKVSASLLYLDIILLLWSGMAAADARCPLFRMRLS